MELEERVKRLQQEYDAEQRNLMLHGKIRRAVSNTRGVRGVWRSSDGYHIVLRRDFDDFEHLKEVERLCGELGVLMDVGM
jgi:hypothetical protein